MATRFYYTKDILPTGDVLPSFDSGWEHTEAALRAPMTPYKAIYSTGSSQNAASGIAYSANDDGLLIQLISPSLKSQNISGTIKGIIQARDTLNSSQLDSQIKVYVVASDGSTIRGTLLDFDTSALASAWASTATNRKFPKSTNWPANLASLDVNRGDRIVVEIGFRTHSVQSPGGLVLYSDTNNTDAAENETGTTTVSGWVEFSQDIVFLPDPGIIRPAKQYSPKTTIGTAGVPVTTTGNVTAWVAAGYDTLFSDFPLSLLILGLAGTLLASTTATTQEHLIEVATGPSGSPTVVLQIPFVVRNVTAAAYVISPISIILPEPYLVPAKSGGIYIRVRTGTSNLASIISARLIVQEPVPSLLPASIISRNSLLRR